MDEIAEAIKAQLLERINKSLWYAVLVDKSTDVDNKATRLVYVQFIFQEDVHEDMLCALLLPTNSMVAELLKSLNVYRSGKLNWSFCINICTGRAAAVTGPISGFITWVKEVASECRSLHCILHREMLTSQRTSPELNNVLQDVIKIINELMFMPLTHIYSHGSVRRCIQSSFIHRSEKAKGRSQASISEL